MENNVKEIDGDDENEEDPLGFPIQDTECAHEEHPSIFSSKISWSKVRGSRNHSL